MKVNTTHLQRLKAIMEKLISQCVGDSNQNIAMLYTFILHTIENNTFFTK